MPHQRPHPAHVPGELVRPFDMSFRGSPDALFARLDALRDHGRVLWLQADMQGGGVYGEGDGAWFFTQGEDIRNALQRPEIFSSRMGGDDSPPALIPNFLDPPEHTKYRRLLNPLFAPAVIDTMESGIRARMRSIVDGLIDRGACDFVTEVATQFPTRVFMEWIGLPDEDTEKSVALVSALMHVTEDQGQRGAAMGAVAMAVNQLIEDRLSRPSNDLMSQIMSRQIDDRPLSHQELHSIAFLLFLAGLDTVGSALSFSFWHLAQQHDDRDAIVGGSIPAEQAAEELLRRHSFVNLPRVVALDTEFAGVQLRKGDLVVLSLPMANRDQAEYPAPREVRLDRQANRHYGFGAGPHRCLGSHLARLEVRIALEEWHARIPKYHLAGDVRSYGGNVMGISTLPLRWP